MIALHQVYKSYGSQNVLEGVSLQVSPGERIGLVGPNGAGKSTILGLFLGRVEPDRGEVFRAKNLRMGYLPQELIQLSGRTVLELAMDTGDRLGQLEAELEEVHRRLAAGPSGQEQEELLARQGQLLTIFEGLGGYDLEARARKVLAGLGFDPGDMERDVGQLSGGWLMRAALARILLSAPEVILLDEPTNHLDLESLIWLEGHLASSPASLVLVSHDRAFLDKVVTRIVEVERGRLYTYGGNYSHYRRQRRLRLKAQEKAYLAQQEEIRRMQDFIDRNRSRKDRARQVQARLKALEKMERLEPPGQDEEIHFELPPVQRSAKVVVELVGVDLAYGEKVVYRGLDFVVKRGDRLALLGRNGAGKSSLLKLLAGGVAPSRGRRLVGGRVKMGMFSQHALQDLDPDNHVLGELATVAGLMPVSRQRSLLGAFLFKGDEVFKKVRVLSGGERGRLVLAKLLVSAPNFLLLDEPTNHLDITSRRVLEEALRQYQGTLVLISHDRRLINAVANQVAYVDQGRVTLLPGNYDDFYRLWKKRLKKGSATPEPGPQAAPSRGDGPEGKGKPQSGPRRKSARRKRAEAEARNRIYRRLKPLRDKLAALEARVEQAQAELDRLVQEMVDPGAYGDARRWAELSRAHDKAKARVERLTGQWEELALELEEKEKECQGAG